MMMRPYWLKIENPQPASGLGLGVGITAYSEDEAKAIFASAFGSDLRLASVQPIAALDEIEQNHVSPNMGNFLIRGIWYPQGFEHIR